MDSLKDRKWWYQDGSEKVGSIVEMCLWIDRTDFIQ